jgi:hypothetical protein
MSKNNRKTGNDYSIEYNSLILAIDGLSNRISQRLFHLCNEYPDAPVSSIDTTILKAKSCANINYINDLDVDTRIKYINAIEEWLQSKQRYYQTEINF